MYTSGKQTGGSKNTHWPIRVAVISLDSQSRERRFESDIGHASPSNPKGDRYVY